MSTDDRNSVSHDGTTFPSPSVPLGESPGMSAAADGKPFRWDPAENCYCGGPEEIYPHRHGTGYYCKRKADRD